MIDRPVLIVKAGKDHYMKPAVFEEMHTHIANSELLDMPEATHYSVWVDPHRQQIINAIRGIIDKQRINDKQP